MVQKLRPLADRVLLKRIEDDGKTTSGIIIPDAAKEKTQKGIVLAVGEGRTFEGKITPLAVKVNDIVYFGKYAGTDVEQDCLIVREDDILAIVEQ